MRFDHTTLDRSIRFPHSRAMSQQSDTRLDPAYTVVMRAGKGNLPAGVKALASVTGKNESWVRRWMMSKAKGGTGGVVPAEYQQSILDWGEPRGLLCPDDFFVRAPSVATASSDAVACS